MKIKNLLKKNKELNNVNHSYKETIDDLEQKLAKVEAKALKSFEEKT